MVVNGGGDDGDDGVGFGGGIAWTALKVRLELEASTLAKANTRVRLMATHLMCGIFVVLHVRSDLDFNLRW